MGAPSPELVEKRAREIALIDERNPDEFTDGDWDQARRELMGIPEAAAPEEVGEELPDEHEIVPGTPGHRAPRAGAEDDDETVGQTLVSGGIEEAVHDQMLEARREEAESERS
jgi:hypothetical protein